MKDLTEEQEWLLKQAVRNFSGSGIPAAETLAGSGAPEQDQEAVRARIERMSAGVKR